MSVYYFIPIICGLIILSAYFSALETAVSVSSKAKLHRALKQGAKDAAICIDLQKKLGLVISVILACCTITNTITTAIATGILVRIFSDKGDIIGAIVMAPLIWIFCEVLPKMFAIYMPEKIFLRSARVVKTIFTFFSPFNHIVNLLASKLLKIVGINTNDSHDQGNLDELKGAIDLHQSINKEDTRDEKAMLKSVLDLGSVTLSKIMIHRKNVTIVDLDDPIEDIVSQILESPFSRIPLYQGSQDNIIAVVHVKALLRSIRTQKDSMTKQHLLKIAHKPWFVPESTDLLEQLKAFRARREHFANVVDEYGTWLGIVTLEDILEEIVGEISDEHDIAFKGVRPQKDGSFIVDGHVTIRDLNRQFDWELPDLDASTIAGLIIYEFRIIPHVGQIFSLDGFRFEVLRRQRNQITLVRIVPPSN